MLHDRLAPSGNQSEGRINKDRESERKRYRERYVERSTEIYSSKAKGIERERSAVASSWSMLVFPRMMHNRLVSDSRLASPTLESSAALACTKRSAAAVTIDKGVAMCANKLYLEVDIASVTL